MATHPNILAWEIPWTGEPGGLQSMGLQSQTQPGNSTHTCIAEPLCCAPETITTLQINALQYKIKTKLKVQDFLTVTP